jgi:energy-converting hydrogenase B subunit D
MSFDLFIDGCLVIGILTLACLCLATKNLFTAIVLFISLGLIVTIAWVRLDAPDLAIAEAAIGAGLTGALLLATWRQLRGQPANNEADTPDKSGGDNVSNP